MMGVSESKWGFPTIEGPFLESLQAHMGLIVGALKLRAPF